MRKIELDPSTPISKKKYERIVKHGYHSLVWYAERYPSGHGKLKERLIRKGFPKEKITVIIPEDHIDGVESKTEEHDLIADTIDMLSEHRPDLADEKIVAETIIRSHLSSGKGINSAWSSFMKKGVSRDVYEEILEQYKDSRDSDDALDRAGERILSSSSYNKKTTEFERKTVFAKAMMRKGFNLSDAYDWYEENYEPLD